MLGIARDADQKAIKDAFRNLAMKYHPDRNKEGGAEERFKEIAEAYAVLSDPKKRAEYDARGFSAVADFSAEDLFGGINFDDIFGGLNFDFGGPFEGFFHRRRTGPTHGANIETELFVPLSRVAAGGEETLCLHRPAACPSCHGTGGEGGAKPEACETCKGTGRVSHRQEKQSILIQQISTCPDCQGRGSIVKNHCRECHGSGEIEADENLTVKIPQGVEEGMALRIPGKGMACAGGAAGDLFVVVHSRADPRFERSGADLLRRETIELTDAVLGTSLEVPTLEGTASVNVPPGTQPGAVLRLKGLGLPEFGSSRHGELYVQIGVRVPEKLSAEERDLYERLRAIGGSQGRSARCGQPTGER